jgi:hypothetical protein
MLIYRKNKFISIAITFILLLPLFLALFTGATEGWAKTTTKKSYLTITLTVGSGSYDGGTVGIDGTKYDSTIGYTVDFSGIDKSKVTYVKNKSGIVEKIKIDKTGLSESQLSKIRINITPKKNKYIYSTDYASSSSYVSTNTTNEVRKIGYYSGPNYCLTNKADNTSLSLFSITGNPSSISLKFGLYSSLTIDGENTSARYNYRYVSDGTATAKKSDSFNGYQITIGKVSTNGETTTNAKFSAMLTALKSFENLIELITYFFFGVALFTSVLAIMVNTVKLATIPAHPIKRRECILNYLYSAICLAFLGSIALVVKLLFQTIF